MKIMPHILVATLLLLLPTYGSDQVPAQKAGEILLLLPDGSDQILTKKVGEILKEASSLKKGDTRADLHKYFLEEAGLSTRTQQTYVSKRCPYIKIDVQFRSVDDKNSKEVKDAWNPKWPSNDLIEKISKPYLAHIVID